MGGGKQRKTMKQHENFLYGDQFVTDYEDLMYYLGEDDLNELPEDYSVKIQLSKSEKIFKMEENWIVDTIIQQTDKWEDRFPEDSDSVFKQIESAIRSGVDFEKINQNLPDIYYPSGEYAVVTKQDLINFTTP